LKMMNYWSWQCLTGEPEGERWIKIEEILPHVQEDDEVFPLAINTLNKLKQISEAEYLSLDLESYKQEPEESV